MVSACSVSGDVPVVGGRGRSHTVRQEVRENPDRSAIMSILKRIRLARAHIATPC